MILQTHTMFYKYVRFYDDDDKHSLKFQILMSVFQQMCSKGARVGGCELMIIMPMTNENPLKKIFYR